MKCPKCHYLGFETGDRCRNCGYDFSLLPQERELMLNPGDEAATLQPAPDLALDPPRESPVFRRAREHALPLFPPPDLDDDQPLVKLPVAPRAPLAVRRTPDLPRSRVVSKPVRREPDAEPEPVLQFVDEAEAAAPDLPPRVPLVPPRIERRSAAAPAMLAASGAGARLGAAAIDHVILVSIDLAIIYFTLRMAGLTMAEWARLPAVPMLAFLTLLELGYFAAFTSMGGQTIGKMAAGIRVVTDDDRTVDPARAMSRALAGIVSFITFGAAFLPAVFSDDRRAVHDRLAHTRVVALPS